jgi:putative FmdB family regulatory protein
VELPTYEYACRSCGEHLEVSQSIKDPALTTCPSCGGELRKVFGAVGIVLKGSGFYRNDSRAPAPKEAASASDGASGEPGETKAGETKGGKEAASGGKEAAKAPGEGSGAAAGAGGAKGGPAAKTGSSSSSKVAAS